MILIIVLLYKSNLKRVCMSANKFKVQSYFIFCVIVFYLVMVFILMNDTFVMYDSFMQFKNSFLFKIIFLSLLFIIITLMLSFYKLSRFPLEFNTKNKLSKLFLQDEALKSISILDPLTKQYNKEYFDLRFDEEYKRAIRDELAISLIIIDVNEFKAYNELYGKKEADSCLRKIANCLNKQCSRPADIVFRIKADVFYVLLPNTKHARLIAQKCKDAVDSLALSHDNSIHSNIVRVSFGFASISAKNASEIDFLINKSQESLTVNKIKKN